MSDQTNLVESAVASVVTLSLEDRKAALVAKLTAEMEHTTSITVKVRNSVYIALINSAGEALLNKLIAKIS